MIARAFTRIVALAALAYLVVPLAVIIGTSLTSTSYLAFPPQGITLKWYAVVVNDESYISAFVTSTLVAVAATLAALVLAVSAALALARHRFAGRAFLIAFFTSPLILPHVVLGAAIIQCAVAAGLVRSIWVLLAGHIVIVMPFVLRSVMPLLTAEQRQLEEASMDLGGGPFQTFFLVTLPQISAGLVSGATLAFISSWINVELSIFSTTATLTTIPVKLFNYVQYTVDPTIAAVSAVTIVLAAGTIILLDSVVGLNLLAERRSTHL